MEVGYDARWMPNGPAMFERARELLGATRRVVVTTDDLAGGGSHRLVDGLVAWGTTEAIRSRIAEHDRTCADHLPLQLVTEDSAAVPRDEWQTPAAALRPASVRP